MMSSMLYVSSFLLLSMCSNLLATTTDNHQLNKTATLSRPSNQLTVEQEEDDYYSDNEPSDSIDSDYATPKHSNLIWFTPAPSTSTSTSTSLPLPSATAAAAAAAEAASSLKRVPRQPQHSWHANRVDSDAAFDEADYQSDQAVGTLTALKQQEVGTAEGVKQRRLVYDAERSRNQTLLKSLASAHRKRIDTEARCRWPQPRVIHINNETSKQYSPKATILHRCDESAGCCDQDFKVCSVKTKQTVELPFFVITTGRPRAQAQMLSLTNHTECECVSLSAAQQTQRRKRSSQCQCPKHFSNFSNTVPWHHGTNCRCDCHLNDATCQRLKNGDEGFAMSERRCILYNDCSPPICNYGVYNSHSGRCPRPQQRHL